MGFFMVFSAGSSVGSWRNPQGWGRRVLTHPGMKRVWSGVWLTCLLAGFLLLLFQPVLAQNAQNGSDFSGTQSHVVELTLNDEMISPITAEYLDQGIEKATEVGADALILKLDTPGGLLQSTHTMVKSILNSPVPVIVYVSPNGARAASAGVFITYAGHVAAMAPSTRIGAAHPVSGGGGAKWPKPGEDPNAPSDKESQKKGESSEKSENDSPLGVGDESIMGEKILNDTVAYARSLAKMRGRNVEWVVRSIEQSESITAQEALDMNVVDTIASTTIELLNDVNGTEVEVLGKSQVLNTLDAEVVPYEFSPQQQFISLLAHPFVSYVLLMIGFYGLLFEVTHAGIGFSGVIGVICLILALIGMQAMPINAAGIGLLVLGMILFGAEFFTPTFGVLAAGGVVSIVLGTLMIYQTQEPFLQEAVPVLLGISVGVAAMTVFILYKVIRVYRKKPVAGPNKLIGETARVTMAIEPPQPGKIRVYGEIWDAVADTPFAIGDRVTVVEADPDRTRSIKVAPLGSAEISEPLPVGSLPDSE